MEEELKKEKVKRAVLALTDLIESGIYDYYAGRFDSSEMVMTKNYGFSDHEIKDLLYSLNQFLNK